MNYTEQKDVCLSSWDSSIDEISLFLWLFSSRGVIESTPQVAHICTDWQFTGGPRVNMSNTLMCARWRSTNTQTAPKGTRCLTLDYVVVMSHGIDSPPEWSSSPPSTFPSFSVVHLTFCHNMLFSKHQKAKGFPLCLCFPGSHILEESLCVLTLCFTFSMFLVSVLYFLTVHLDMSVWRRMTSEWYQ